ncbi:Uncharacterised protein [Weissella viridescens]|uniref:Uncharacterized protein n=1 Tax=Weissella viridescens TaxID=1629 RepID=A0A380P6J0_WEIVI|nr:Uncharacterised protein [Weissella viridescens]
MATTEIRPAAPQADHAVAAKLLGAKQSAVTPDVKLQQAKQAAAQANAKLVWLRLNKQLPKLRFQLSHIRVSTSKAHPRLQRPQ